MQRKKTELIEGLFSSFISPLPKRCPILPEQLVIHLHFFIIDFTFPQNACVIFESKYGIARHERMIWFNTHAVILHVQMLVFF